MCGACGDQPLPVITFHPADHLFPKFSTKRVILTMLRLRFLDYNTVANEEKAVRTARHSRCSFGIAVRRKVSVCSTGGTGRVLAWEKGWVHMYVGVYVGWGGACVCMCVGEGGGRGGSYATLGCASVVRQVVRVGLGWEKGSRQCFDLHRASVCAWPMMCLTCMCQWLPQGCRACFSPDRPPLLPPPPTPADASPGHRLP